MVHENRYLKRGFSLMEILVAVAIMALMAALVGPSIIRTFRGQSVKATESEIKVLKGAVNSYYLNNLKYPNTLEDLVEKPEGVSEAKWGGPYLEGGKLPASVESGDIVYELTPGDKKEPFKITALSLEESAGE